jgi:hypothetical protein
MKSAAKHSLQCRSLKNKRGRTPSANLSASHARPFDTVREKSEKISALHVDRYRFGKLKLQRRLRPKLDVFLACH